MAVVSSDLQLSEQLTVCFWSFGIHRQSKYPPVALVCLKTRIPKGFRLKAQGCEERATLGSRSLIFTQPQRGCANRAPSVHRALQPSRNAACNHAPVGCPPSHHPMGRG